MSAAAKAMLLCLAAGLGSCAAPLARIAPTATYANPVIDADFPDPAVLKAKDGYYYVYATQGGPEGATSNIQAARSRDLVDWERLPDDDPRGQAHDIYQWVGYLQETLVEAVSR